jgi:dolichol-phosphate mannosyltransferase
MASANRIELQERSSLHDDLQIAPRHVQRCYWIALPAYNEELSLPPLLERIANAMDGASLSYKVIVVNDGSRDRTAQIVSQYSQHMPILLENHAVNMGLGATMRDGVLKAMQLADAHDIVVTMDADNSHNPELIDRMGRLIREGNDVVIASRYQPGSRVLGVPGYRRLLSVAARHVFSVAFPIRGVRDYTCGFRAYRAGALQLALAHYGNSFFDQPGFQCIVDLLLKLRRFPFTFTEVPMVLRYDLKEGGSKMNVVRTIRSTLLLLVKRRCGL